MKDLYINGRYSKYVSQWNLDIYISRDFDFISGACISIFEVTLK